VAIGKFFYCEKCQVLVGNRRSKVAPRCAAGGTHAKVGIEFVLTEGELEIQNAQAGWSVYKHCCTLVHRSFIGKGVRRRGSMSWP
jgi:hypothetical protein